MVVNKMKETMVTVCGSFSENTVIKLDRVLDVVDQYAWEI